MSKRLVFSRCFLCTVIGLVLLMSQGLSDEEKDHVPVGERGVAQVPLSASEKDQQEQLSLEKEEQEELVGASGVVLACSYCYHGGAIHQVASVSSQGELAEIEDGSIWSVASNDTYKVRQWWSGDVVNITQNRSWFSWGYQYQLNNRTRGCSARANLSLGPVKSNPNTRRIVNIDYYHNIVELGDRSYWGVAGGDASALSSWLPGDYVIIGDNDGFLAYKRPHILINVNTNDYVRAKIKH